MPHLVIAIVLGIVLLLIWVVGLIIGFMWQLLAMACGAAVALTLVVEGVGLFLAFQQGKNPLTDGTGAARAAIKALHQRWYAELPALRTVQGGGLALIEQPWYLVIGGSGVGKTRLLQDSGLGFISQSPRPAGREPTPTGTFDWWCTNDAAFLDTAGRLLTDPRAQGEWRHLLKLIARARSTPGINGIILCVNIADLITKGRNLTAEAGAIRERLDELTAALGVAIPLYVVGTKCDNLGGFKDFAAALRRGEKEQVLGATLAWPITGQPATLWPEEHKKLVDALQNRRLVALSTATGDDAVRKLFQFPIQFQATARFLQEWLDALCRPGLHASAVLRGCYFTSCFHAQTLTTGAAPGMPGSAPSTASSATAAGSPANGKIEQTIFLAASQSGFASSTAVQDVLDTKIGFFVRHLLTKVLPADRNLAQPTWQARIFARQMRLFCLLVVPVVAAIALIWITSTGWRQTSLIAETRAPADEVREISHNRPDDVPRNLEALDRLGDRIAGLIKADNGRLGPAIDGVTNLYLSRIRELFLDPCVARMGVDLSRLRTAPAAATGKSNQQDELYDLFRSYQMLTGAIRADSEVLVRTLTDQRRWYTGIDQLAQKIDKNGKVDYHTEQLAKRQLELLPRILNSGRGAVDADRRLVDAITQDLGESLWLRRGYEDLIRSLQNQFPEARAELLESDKATLVTTHTFTLVYSQRGWDDAVRRGLNEKADALSRTFQELDIRLPKPEIERRLTELYAEDHRRQWLTLIATPRAAPAKDFRDVPEMITRLSAKGSPYPGFIRSALKQLNLKTTAMQLFSTSEDLAWSEPCLRALGELRKDVETFIAATEPWKRGQDPAKLRGLTERINTISGRIGEALSGVQPEDKRDAIKRGFDSILYSLYLPLDRELAVERDGIWQAQVASVFAQKCAGKFPFDKDAKTEIPLADFAKVLNPVSGVLWGAITPIEQLRAATVLGHPGVTLDDTYAATIAQATRLRDLFFAGNSETVNAPFSGTLVQREGVEDMVFSIGSQSFGYYERPDAHFTAALKQSEPLVVKISIRILKGQWRPRELSNENWGWMRLMRTGEPQIQEKGGYLMTWPIEATVTGKPVTFKACMVLEPTGIEQAIFGDLLTQFTIPKRIIPHVQ